MVGNIICPVQFEEAPFDPSSIFDPVTNTATEADFIRLLEAGIYDSSLIGKFVTLSNSVDYDGCKWVIADVNHDSTNTGQTNCYDLISENCFYSTAFGYDQNWRNSTPRTWLNNTFYDGFGSAFKARIINPKYKSITDWYTDDKIIIPSSVEINASASGEGIAYPVFTDDTSRRKITPNNESASWWTRTASFGSYIMSVSTGGSTEVANYWSSLYLAPILRVQ